MNHENITTALTGHIARLRSDAVAEIDFAQLQSDLEAAVEAIAALAGRAAVADQLLALFRSDLLRHARATTRLTGRSTALTEKLIRAESATLAELLALKADIDQDFDSAFARTLSEPRHSGTSDGAKLEQYKVGSH